MNAVPLALKLATAALLLVTIAVLAAVILSDPAKSDHLIMYLMMVVIFVIGISNIYGGFQHVQGAATKGEQTVWYRQSRLVFGLLIVLCLLGWLGLNGIGDLLPYTVQNVARTIVLVVLGLPALAILALTMRNRSRA